MFFAMAAYLQSQPNSLLEFPRNNKPIECSRISIELQHGEKMVNLLANKGGASDLSQCGYQARRASMTCHRKPMG